MSRDGSAGRLDRVSRVIEENRVGRATGVGFVAFPVGYLLTAAAVAIGGSIDTSKPVEAARVIGYAFYNGHTVPVHTYGQQASTVEGGPTQLRSFSELVNLIQQRSTSIPPEVYYLIPVVVLLAAGAILASRYLDDELGTARQAGVVAGLVLGYLVAMLGATFLVTETVSNGPAWTTLNPERLRTVAAGIGYPLVLGIIGTSAVVLLRRGTR